MSPILIVVLEIMVLFLGAWFAFWLVDHAGFPVAPGNPPFAFILRLVVIVIFLIILLGLFGVFGPGWHPALFTR